MVQPKAVRHAQNVPFWTTLAMCGAIIAEADFRLTSEASYSAGAGVSPSSGSMAKVVPGTAMVRACLPSVGAARRGPVPAGHGDAGSAGRPPSVPGAQRSGDLDGQRRQEHV